MPVGNKKRIGRQSQERPIDSLIKTFAKYNSIAKKRYVVRLKIRGGLRLEIMEG